MQFSAALVCAALVFSACSTPQQQQVRSGVRQQEQPIVDEKTPTIPHVYTVTTGSIQDAIDAGAAYLRRVQHPELGGVYKTYYATIDEFEPNLYTVYTASFISTLLNAQSEVAVPMEVSRAADFLLMMQNTSEADPQHGAFAYLYALKDGTKEEKFVAGTAANAVFALIGLHERTSDERYLQAAQKAGDWLLTMIQPAGNVWEYKRMNEQGSWVSGGSDSTIYNGQVLSALSRLYSHTGEERYRTGARKITSYFLQKVGREGCYVGDAYREPNPVSSMWIVYSLIDFNAAQPDDSVEYTILDCAKEIAEMQYTDEKNRTRHGRWEDVSSAGGVGWVSESFVRTHAFCTEQQGKNCDLFRDVAIRSIRWLFQRTYSSAYSEHLPNPLMAIGGLFQGTGLLNRHVATDSVTSAVNTYSSILPLLQEDGVLLDITPR